MKIIYWIKAARLRTLPLALSCILMGASLATIKDFNIQPKVLILTFLTTILLQILSNYANDYGDGIKGTDANRKNSDRMVQSGHITSKQMLNATIFISVLTFISGIILLINTFNYNQLWKFLVFLSVGLLSIISAIKYTVGKNAYAYSGFGDVVVFIFFGLVGVIGSFFLFTGSFHWYTIPGSLFTGLMSCGVLNMNNLRDFENDKLSNKNTIVVYLGIKRAKIYQFALIVTAKLSLATIIIFSRNLILFTSFVPLFFLVKHIVFVTKNNELEKFDTQLKLIALTSFFSCLILLFVSYFT